MPKERLEFGSVTLGYGFSLVIICLSNQNGMLTDERNVPKLLWLSPTILTWIAKPLISDSGDNVWRRPYEIWSHAESLLQGDPSEFQRTDELTTLKRAIDRREQQLNTFHNFKRIPIADKPKGGLELLEYLGLIRPLMLQRLIKIRNAVEHEDTPPPTVQELRIFVEFVWYFLRSTDNNLRNPIEEFSLEPRESSPYGVEVRLSSKTNWIPKIRASVEPGMLSIEQKDGWFLINMIKIETRQQVLEKSPEETGLAGKNPDDILFDGEVRAPKEAILQLIRISLQLV